MERALKAVKAAGFTRARIIMHLEARVIEIIIGDDAPFTFSRDEPNPWDNE